MDAMYNISWEIFGKRRAQLELEEWCGSDNKTVKIGRFDSDNVPLHSEGCRACQWHVEYSVLGCWWRKGESPWCHTFGRAAFQSSRYAKLVTSRSAKIHCDPFTSIPSLSGICALLHSRTLVRKKEIREVAQKHTITQSQRYSLLNFIGIWSKSLLQPRWHTNLNLPVMSKNSGFIFPAPKPTVVGEGRKG